ncbi:MAG TPA: hypothetical protein VJQ78_11725 [Sphingobium sp.]|nr:hypothetical protein [Sphingobium sp.]
MIRAASSKRWHAPLLATAPLLLSAVIAAPALAQSVILPEGMAIPLQVRQDVSSKTAHVGDEVDLAVAKAVTIGGVPVIPAGSPVVGEVVQARDNGLLGRSGKLDIKVSRIRAGQTDVPVRGDRNAKGQSGTLGAVGAGIVFLPLALIIRGKDVTLRAGTTFDVYVDKEVSLSGAGPGATPDTAGPLASEAAPSAIRSIDPNDAITGR